jgi:hypothetical protein
VIDDRSMNGHSAFLFAALVFMRVFAAVSPAFGEPTPSADSAESCTLDKQRQVGEECLVCTAWSGDSAKCQKRLSPRGYQRRCRGGGDATWSEVWCHPAGAAGRATP